MIYVNRITRRHDVQCRQDGQINLSAYVTHALNLVPGDVIDIAVEQADQHREYYLYVQCRSGETRGRHLGACRQVNEQGCGYLRVNNVRLSRFVLDACHAENVVRIRAGEPIDHPELGSCITLILRGQPIDCPVTKLKR